MFAVAVVPAQMEVLKQSGVPPIALPLTPVGVIHVEEVAGEGGIVAVC